MIGGIGIVGLGETTVERLLNPDPFIRDWQVRDGVAFEMRSPVRAIAFTGRIPIDAVMYAVPAEYAAEIGGTLKPNASLPSCNVITLLPGQVCDFGRLQPAGVVVLVKTQSLITFGGSIAPLVDSTVGGQLGECMLLRTWGHEPPASGHVSHQVVPVTYASSAWRGSARVDVTRATHVTVAFPHYDGPSGVYSEPTVAGDLPAGLGISWAFGAAVLSHEMDQFTAAARGALSLTHYMETYEVPRGATRFHVSTTNGMPGTPIILSIGVSPCS